MSIIVHLLYELSAFEPALVHIAELFKAHQGRYYEAARNAMITYLSHRGEDILPERQEDFEAAMERLNAVQAGAKLELMLPTTGTLLSTFAIGLTFTNHGDAPWRRFAEVVESYASQVLESDKEEPW